MAPLPPSKHKSFQCPPRPPGSPCGTCSLPRSALLTSYHSFPHSIPATLVDWLFLEHRHILFEALCIGCSFFLEGFAPRYSHGSFSPLCKVSAERRLFHESFLAHLCKYQQTARYNAQFPLSCSALSVFSERLPHPTHHELIYYI